MIRSTLGITPLGGSADGTSLSRVQAAAARIGLTPEDADRQAAQLDGIAQMVRSIDEERLRLRREMVAATGEFEASATQYTEDQARVALFRVKAALRFEPLRKADILAGFRPRDAKARVRDRVRTLQHHAVEAGLLPPARLGPLEYPQA
eukprot:6201757-Alexandrium_andersonii.AAC.1